MPIIRDLIQTTKKLTAENLCIFFQFCIIQNINNFTYIIEWNRTEYLNINIYVIMIQNEVSTNESIFFNDDHLLRAIDEQGSFVVNVNPSVALDVADVVKDHSDPIKLPRIESSVPKHQTGNHVVGKLKVVAPNTNKSFKKLKDSIESYIHQKLCLNGLICCLLNESQNEKLPLKILLRKLVYPSRIEVDVFVCHVIDLTTIAICSSANVKTGKI